MLAVADTSPLNYLSLVGSIEILPELYGKIVVPAEVRDELLARGAPILVHAWAEDPPSWVDVCACDPVLRDNPQWRSLDLGERAAIALAVAQRPSILLMDEQTGTEIARAQGIAVVGTLGVLDEAARRRLIPLPETLERLKRTSFRYPKVVVERLLREDARRRSG